MALRVAVTVFCDYPDCKESFFGYAKLGPGVVGVPEPCGVPGSGQGWQLPMKGDPGSTPILCPTHLNEIRSKK